MAARAVSSGLPPPGWTAGPLACPLLPPEVPSSARWFIPSLHEMLSSSSPSGTTNSAICSRIQASGSLPLMSSFASDQVIPFSVPRAASLQSLGHPILFDWPPHLSHQVIPLWAGGPWLSHCGTIPCLGSRPSLPVFTPLISQWAFLFRPADGSRPSLEPLHFERSHLLVPALLVP